MGSSVGLMGWLVGDGLGASIGSLIGPEVGLLVAI